MGVTAFTRAEPAQSGLKPTSRQWNRLAAAFNDRLRSGYGDPTWRVWWKAMALTREFRAAEGLATPAQDEWLHFYMNARPEDGGPAGTLNEEGPLTQVALGNATLEYPSEATRLNEIPAGTPATAAGKWALGKLQRGVWAWQDALMTAPALEAARSWEKKGHRWVYGYREAINWGEQALNQNARKYMATWGGWLGQATVDIYYDAYSDWHYFWTFKFTSLVAGVASRVINTKPAAYGGDGLVNVRYYPDRYVLDWGTRTEVLAFEQWVEGPYYDGAALHRRDADVLDQVAAAAAGEFHGSDGQREGDNFKIEEIGFDFQRFLSRQYQLAPARGVAVPDEETPGGLLLEAQYPKWRMEGPLAEGAAGTLATGGQSHRFIEPFSLCGYLVTITGTSEAVTLRLVDDDTGEELPERGRFTVRADGLYWFNTYGLRPSLRVVLGSELPAGAVIELEAAELETRRPGVADAYVVLRRGSTSGAAGSLDTCGFNYADAKGLGDRLFEAGAIIHGEDVPESAAIEENPFYEAARGLLQGRMRLLKRENFLSHAVESGRAVLYFNRTMLGGEVTLDLWRNLAPPLEAIPSGKLMSGVLYQVHGSTGTVYHAGQYFVPGATFTAAAGEKEYDATGDCTVKQVDGIIPTAPEGGLSSEWLMFMSFAPYDSGTMQPDDYADPLAWLMNRCQIFSTAIGDRNDFQTQYETGITAIRPISPAGHTYAEQSNTSADPKFYDSCPIYPPDYRVVSVRNQNAGGAYSTTVVRVELETELRSETDGERSDANGLADYLAYRDSSTDCPVRLGDQAAIRTDELVNGCCLPRFYFTKLVPLVREDEPENEVMERTDTRLLAQEMRWCHWLLEAICEGYIDPEMSTEGCRRKPNFTFETLCLKATGSRWLEVMPWFVRADRERGYGAMPNVKAYAAAFNAMVECVNCLTRVPVEVPMPLQERSKTFAGKRTLLTSQDNVRTGDDGNYGEDVVADIGGAPSDEYREWPIDQFQTPDREGVENFTMPDGTGYPFEGESESAWSAWVDVYVDPVDPPTSGYGCTNGVAWSGYDFEDSGDPANPYVVRADLNLTELRFDPEKLSLRAVPEALRTVLAGSGGLTMYIYDIEEWFTNDAETAEQCGNGWWDAGRKRRHESTTFRCVGVELPEGFLDGSSTISILPRPMQPSTVGTYIDPAWPARCYFGPYSSAAVLGFGYMYADVPLEGE